MLKKILLLIIMFSLLACGEKKVEKTEKKIVKKAYTKDGKIFSGKCKEYYAGGERVLREWRYKNGLLDGEYKAFYKDGKIKEKGNYKNGLMVGKYETYYPNGNKTSEVELKNGKIQGKGKVYTKDGKLYMIIEYKNNKIEKCIISEEK